MGMGLLLFMLGGTLTLFTMKMPWPFCLEWVVCPTQFSTLLNLMDN